MKKDINKDLFGQPLRPVMPDPDCCTNCGKTKNDHHLNPHNYNLIDHAETSLMQANDKAEIVCNQFTSGIWTTHCWCGKNDKYCDGNCITGSHDGEE